MPGEPLYRHRLLSAEPEAQAQVLAQLGAFLAALHAIPIDGLPVPPWQQPGQHETAQSRALARLEHVQQQIYPHLWRDQRAWIEHLYAPVTEGTLDLDGFTLKRSRRVMASSDQCCLHSRRLCQVWTNDTTARHH